jgi:hypothetical protein
LNKPRLNVEIDADEYGSPFIVSNFINEDGWRVDGGIESGGYINALFYRLRVRNKGRAPALNCEARFRVYVTENGVKRQEPVSGLLHWVIRDPTLEPDRQFEPIHLNPGAPPESLDLLMLPYTIIVTHKDGKPHRDTYYADELRIYSVRPYLLCTGKDYELEVTVSANNASARPFHLKLNWDGSPERFQNGSFIAQ